MIVIIRGGGDLASGIAIRLNRAGLNVVILELEKPLAIRRTVSFAEAVYAGVVSVEGVTARCIENEENRNALNAVIARGEIAVLVDPFGKVIEELDCRIVVDARMLKVAIDKNPYPVDLTIGLGPGFSAGINCHAVIETQRGHTLGRVIWHGSGKPDSGVPDAVNGYTYERVLRAPKQGNLVPRAMIGAHIISGQVIAEVGGDSVEAPFDGVLRGLIHPDVFVHKGRKIGDIDPRNDSSVCELVSDKALAVGGGVLEAILSNKTLRQELWC